MSHITCTTQRNSLVKVELSDDPFSKSTLTFWVPVTSLDEHGWVPAQILRARVKHATGQNLGHFSYTHKIEK